MQKYPSTPYLNFCKAKPQDTYFGDFSHFETAIVTEKMDGENTSMYRDAIHARSLDSNQNETPTLKEARSYVRALHGKIKHLIPTGYRICGENLYAKHTIHYQNLASYFQVFLMVNSEGDVLSYQDTLAFCDSLGLTHVALLGTFTNSQNWLKTFEDFYTELLPAMQAKTIEGMVVRNAGNFSTFDFQQNVFKAVPSGFVQTDEHWRNKPVVANKLKR